jgi:uncharacterized membrane protein
MVALGQPAGSTEFMADAVNTVGQVAGSCWMTAAGTWLACLYTPGQGWTVLAPISGWKTFNTSAVNDHGQVVGSATPEREAARVFLDAFG